MISWALQEQRIVFGVPRCWHDDWLTGGARMWHFPDIANQKGHPFVCLQDFHCLDVGCFLEALTIYLDNLVTYL